MLRSQNLTVNQPQTFIWNDIKDLLHEHDCVIVPGFGGFVCNREPARIDQVSHIITPPSRKVVFNQNLKTNDGLLAGYLVQKRQIAYPQAMQIIEETVQQLLELLQEKKQLAIDLFGSFRLNADANYVFLPDKNNNYLLSSYGLAIIQAAPVPSRTIGIHKSRSLKRKKETKTMKAQKNVWPKVLVSVLVLLLTVNGYIFLQEHTINDLHIGSNNTTSIASWFDSVFSSKKSDAPVTVAIPAITETENPVVIPPPPVPIDTFTAESADSTVEPVMPEPETTQPDLYAYLDEFAKNYAAARPVVYFPQQPAEIILAAAEAAVIKETPAVIIPEPTKAATASIASKGFYVIGGVFCKERNALRYLSQLSQNGYAEAELLLNQNIHCKRVSYKKFASRHDAEQFCFEIKAAENPSAWVLAIEN